MRTTTNHNLISTAIFATLILAGCNRALPTEPVDLMMSEPSYEAAPASYESENDSSYSGRLRPARAVRPSPTTPSGPTGPSTTPSPEPPNGEPSDGSPSTAPPPAAPPNPPTSPTPPTTATTDCSGPCDGILRIPSSDDYMAAIYAARDRVRSAVASGEIKANKTVRDWNVTPRVEWKACFFWVENGFWYDSDGNRHVGGCAAGMTDFEKKKIVISTKQESRTLALVKWEATNYYLYLIGRKDLLDRWQ